MCVCVFVLSDDDSRVVLTEIPGVMGSNYINASFITVRISFSVLCDIETTSLSLRDIMEIITISAQGNMLDDCIISHM